MLVIKVVSLFGGGASNGITGSHLGLILISSHTGYSSRVVRVVGGSVVRIVSHCVSVSTRTLSMGVARARSSSGGKAMPTLITGVPVHSVGRHPSPE